MRALLDPGTCQKAQMTQDRVRSSERKSGKGCEAVRVLLPTGPMCQLSPNLPVWS